MKKGTLLLLMLSGMASFSQSKTTGTINLVNVAGVSGSVTANLTLNSATSKATLVMSGPSDRWFAVQFTKNMSVKATAMRPGFDVVYWNGTKIVDAAFVEEFVTVENDAQDDWKLVGTPMLNTPSAGLVTVTVERAFDTGDANDYVFTYSDTSIGFSWARKSATSTAGFVPGSHGSTNATTGVNPNAGYANNVPFTGTLGTEDFTLNATTISPVPSKGVVTLKTTTSLEKINIYSQTGALLKTQAVNSVEATQVEVKDLATGIYLLELVNAKDNAWKKIIIE
jgi:hypothetical protein